MKVGRPSKYKPKFCKMLIEHMRGGLSYESFAAVVKTHFDTLYEWEKVHPEFSEAKKIGKALSLHWWEEQGNIALHGNPNFNTTIWIFAMKNRHGWRDKTEQKMEVSIQQLPDDVLIAEAQRRLNEKNHKP